MWWENIQNLFEKFGYDKKKEGRKDGGKGDGRKQGMKERKKGKVVSGDTKT